MTRIESSPCETCPSRDESVFQNLSPKELALLNKCKTTNTYKKKQIIFYEGNVPYAVHCIRKGSIKLYRTTPEGKEQIVRLAKDGEMIGYKALLSSEKYSLTAEALEDSEVCSLDRNAFLELLDHSPKLARQMLESICTDMRSEEDTICRYSQKSVRERVAETLLILKERYGVPHKKGIRLQIDLSREDIASLSGTVLESLVRYLSEFKSDGLVEVNGREIVIVKPESLLKVACNQIV